MNKLTVYEWTNIIIAISTFIYTVGTFLLWFTTLKTSKQNQKLILITEQQLKREEEIKQIESISSVHKNFRELFSSFLADDKSLDILSANVGNTNKEDVRKNYLASFLINNAYELFELHQYNLLPEDFWMRTEIDMRALFQWQFVASRWSKLKTIYSTEFQKFIEERILIIDIR